MELTIEPEMYCPSIDEMGNYIDKLPCFNAINYGVRCPCGSRKDKIYNSLAVFAAHTKSKCHQKWLNHININKTNYYSENETLKNTIQNQKWIIAKMEKDIKTKIMTIDYLTQQITNLQETNMTVENLLDL
jgi:septal ring factor EnvC (AmiA/AmiB activator)